MTSQLVDDRQELRRHLRRAGVDLEELSLDVALEALDGGVQRTSAVRCVVDDLFSPSETDLASPGQQ